MNTAVLFASVILLLFTLRKKIKMVYMISAIPASWIAHAIFTFPAAILLGIIKYNPEHIRTAGEHRAVFILASIPIIVGVLMYSKLFQE